MTLDDRVFLDLSDLRTIRFECATCSAAITYDVAKWTSVPHGCPGCNALWMHPTPDGPYEMLNKLRLALKWAGSGQTADAPVRVKFEVSPKRP